MQTKSKVPKIRFKGFSGEWEVKIINDLGDIITGSTPNTQDKSNYGGNYLFVSPADIQNNRYVETTITTLTTKGHNLGRVLHENSILFVSIGSTIGKVAQIKNKVTTNQQINAINPNKYNNSNFIYSMLVHKSQDIKKLAFTQAVPIINKTNFSEIEVIVPKDIKEQQKIGNFFQKLDKLIDLKEKKYQKLQQFKKASLDKMFPKNGASTPEVRFQGFSGEWEEKSLGDIGQFKSSTGFSEKEQGGKKGVPFFKVSDMNLSNNKSFMNEANNYVSQEQIERMQYKPINELSIIFAKVGAAIFLERKRIAKNFLLDNNMMAFSPNVDIFFLFHWISNIKLSKFTQVGALPSYNANDLRIISISIPSLEEQEKIGNYFQKLDKQIDLQSKEIEKLKNIKKALLDKMFV